MTIKMQLDSLNIIMSGRVRKRWYRNSNADTSTTQPKIKERLPTSLSAAKHMTYTVLSRDSIQYPVASSRM